MKQLRSTLIELLEKNKLDLSNIQIKLVEYYVELLLKNNKNVNLISRKDENNIIERHIIPCLIFSNVFGQFSGTFLDIGTGGGFPGVPFAIKHKESSGILVDSIGKKIKVLREIIQEIKLNNVQLICTRVEENSFQVKFQNKFDMIISRGTSSVHKLIYYSKSLLKDQKSILAIMKGGDLTSELNDVKEKMKNIQIRLIPLIYFPENEFNQNKKFAVIVENI